eukprot:UN22787
MMMLSVISKKSDNIYTYKTPVEKHKNIIHFKDPGFEKFKDHCIFRKSDGIVKEFLISPVKSINNFCDISRSGTGFHFYFWSMKLLYDKFFFADLTENITLKIDLSNNSEGAAHIRICLEEFDNAVKQFGCEIEKIHNKLPQWKM